MPRRAAGLTAAKVKVAGPGRYGDGGGLYLLVRGPQAKFWIFRYVVQGKMKEAGLGPAVGPGSILLADARESASEMRRQVRAGIDPIEARLSAKAVARDAAEKSAITFDHVAKLFLASRETSWRNQKHRAQWEMTLRDYAGPHLGRLPIQAIATDHVVAALTPLWNDKHETASRLRGRIEAVLDFASVRGWRSGENPARWRGHLDKIFPKRSRTAPVVHHAALPWPDLPGFTRQLRGTERISALALELTILCATRTSETLLARWSEIDLEGRVWTVPAERMKVPREHRIPLSDRAVAVLRSLLPLKQRGDSFIFPGRRWGRPLSPMALLMVLRRLGRGDLTVHGFRSTFRDWAGETTSHPREVVEAALAHRTGDRVEQAYARGDLFAKRRKLMEDWASYVETG